MHLQSCRCEKDWLCDHEELSSMRAVHFTLGALSLSFPQGVLWCRVFNSFALEQKIQRQDRSLFEIFQVDHHSKGGNFQYNLMSEVGSLNWSSGVVQRLLIILGKPKVLQPLTRFSVTGRNGDHPIRLLAVGDRIPKRTSRSSKLVRKTWI